jgi:hypothetical protein
VHKDPATRRVGGSGMRVGSGKGSREKTNDSFGSMVYERHNGQGGRGKSDGKKVTSINISENRKVKIQNCSLKIK